MNEERVGWLIEVLAKAGRGQSVDPYLEPLEFDVSSWHCGTAACAGGLLCLDPRAFSAGLSLEHGFSGYPVPRYRPTPSHPDLDTYDALAAFLGIEVRQAIRIFCPTDYLPAGDDPETNRIWYNSEARREFYRTVTPAVVRDRVREVLGV